MAAAHDIHVLVVDDQEVIRDTLQVALDDEGFSVECAANGREALAVIGRWKPDVILLDLMMPVMDGWQFRREQQDDPALAHIPVLVITAAGAQQASTISATELLAKPLRIERVLDVLGRYC